MVVHHLDLLRFTVPPYETDPILVVNPDAVLPLPVAGEGLKVIARKRAQVIESLGCVKLRELALRDPGNASKPAGSVSLEQGRGVSVPEGPDHLLSILRMP
jgi:hypothetical protein